MDNNKPTALVYEVMVAKFGRQAVLKHYNILLHPILRSKPFGIVCGNVWVWTIKESENVLTVLRDVL